MLSCNMPYRVHEISDHPIVHGVKTLHWLIKLWHTIAQAGHHVLTYFTNIMALAVKNNIAEK